MIAQSAVVQHWLFWNPTLPESLNLKEVLNEEHGLILLIAHKPWPSQPVKWHYGERINAFNAIDRIAPSNIGIESNSSGGQALAGDQKYAGSVFSVEA